MKQFKKLMVFMLAALMVFGTIKYTPIYAEDAVAKEEGVFDTVTFEGKKDITIHAGKPFTFTQKIKKENEINTGEEEIIPETENASQEKKKPIVTVKATREGDSAKYRAIVAEVKTPEGGNFVYHEGDTTFMPAEAEVGKEYVITYQAETSIDDGKTWQEVPDAKYEVHIKIAEKEEQHTESEEQLTSEESEDEHNQENLQITADDIVFHGDNEKTISIGANYNFYDMNNIYASGPSDHQEMYAITVNKIETPEGGSYVYQNGDQQFTPTKDDSNLDYTITYGVSVSTDDGKTWHKVDNAEFVTKLHIAKEETTRSARRRRSVPIYAGMISQLDFTLDSEYYTGQSASSRADIAINASSTVDEPFYLEVVFPKNQIYGPQEAEEKYRLKASDLQQSLETRLYEDANNYYISYKLQSGAHALVFSVPFSWKFVRNGLIPDNTQISVSVIVKTLNGDVIKEVKKNAVLKWRGKPIDSYATTGLDSYARYSHDYKMSIRTDSESLNSTATALTNDVSKLADVILCPVIQLNQEIKKDIQGDVIGIRKISKVIDTYVLPDIAYVDVTKLPQGTTYNPATHTIVRVMDNVTDWGVGGTAFYNRSEILDQENFIRFRMPTAVIGQKYQYTFKREYQFDGSSSENFEFNSSGNIEYTTYNFIYNYNYAFLISRKQTGQYSVSPSQFALPGNIINWNSNPYTEMNILKTLNTNDPNPTAAIANNSVAGMKITSNNLAGGLLYNSIILNYEQDSRPSTFHGTFRVIGTRTDGTDIEVANNITYPIGTKLEIPINEPFKSVKLVASDNATMDNVVIYPNWFRSNNPDADKYDKHGVKVRFTYKFDGSLSNNDPHVFSGDMRFEVNDSSVGSTFFDYGRRYSDGFFDQFNESYAITSYPIYDFAFYYRPNDNGKYDIIPFKYAIDVTSNVGDIQTANFGFTYLTVDKSQPLKNGKLKAYIPDGYQIDSEEIFLTAQYGVIFSKTVAQMKSSRTGPFIEPVTGRTYYMYDIGDITGLGANNTNNHGILQFKLNLKHIAYTPGINVDSDRRKAGVILTFDDVNSTYLDELKTRNNKAEDDAKVDGRFKIHEYGRTRDHWMAYSPKIRNVVSNYVIKSEWAQETTKISVESSYYRFLDAENVLKTSSKRLNFSGYDYINNLIDLEIKINSDSTRNQLLHNGTLQLNLPTGFEIVSGSESLVDNNGNFTSDVSTAQILSSQAGNKYSFGNITINRNQNIDLTFKLKVKVKSDAVVGTSNFNTVFKTDELSSRELLGINERTFNYIPPNALYSSLTGFGTTQKTQISYDNQIQYEYTIGNFTGSPVDGFTIIDYLPEVGDLDIHGDSRGTEVTTKFSEINKNDYTVLFEVYYSYVKPIPGMSVAEYDGIADWSTSPRYGEEPKAIKIQSNNGSKIPANFLKKIATLTMKVPPNSVPEDINDKVINNTFFIKYKVNDLSTNYVESNQKQYEVIPPKFKINAKMFLDINRNGVYDDEDELLQTYAYSNPISINTVQPSNNTLDNPVWDVRNYGQQGGNEFITKDISIPGEYKLSVNVSAPYELIAYGQGGNESNIHPDTGLSEAINFSENGVREININIGVKYKGYIIKYDLNGGHIRGTTKTAYYQMAEVGRNISIITQKNRSFLYPYHLPVEKWTTNPDGTGTVYTSYQLITGGLSSVGDVTITLYAQWEKVDNYTVRYNRAGPSELITGNMSDDHVNFGDVYQVRNNEFTNPNAEFAGWNSNSAGTGRSFYEGQTLTDVWDGDPYIEDYNGYGTTYTLMSSPIVYNLYARWRQTLYTFKYESTPYNQWTVDVISNPDHPSTSPTGGLPEGNTNNWAASTPVVGAKFKITKINDDGSEGEVVSQAVSKEHGQLYFKHMLPGDYYLIEEEAPDGYFPIHGKWTIKVRTDTFTGDLVITSATKSDSTMKDLGRYLYSGKSANLAIPNEKMNFNKVTLSVRISDPNPEYASINQNFRYKLTFLDRNFEPMKNMSFNYIGQNVTGVANANPAPLDGTIETDENGVAYITLKHGQQIQIQNAVSTSKISVYQITNGGDVYTQTNESGFAFNPDKATGVTVSEPSGNIQVIDYKIMNFSPVPTGIHHMNNKSILLGVGVIVFLMLAAYSVYIRKRRYHRINISEDRDIYASRMVPKGVKVDAYQEDQTEIKPPVGGPSPGIRNPHHRSRDSTDLQLPIWMVSDTG